MVAGRDEVRIGDIGHEGRDRIELRHHRRRLEIGDLEIEVPAVVAVLSGEGAGGEAYIAEGLGADLVEVRLDLIPGDGMKILREVRQATTLPIIATNRWAVEGGAFPGRGGREYRCPGGGSGLSGRSPTCRLRPRGASLLY